MRGKGPSGTSCERSAGITPAYAGKRHSRQSPRKATWDHPRVCGEKMQAALLHGPFRGSPPRMRGKALSPSHSLHFRRITPAYAGKRAFSMMDTWSFRDHPRVCGEKLLILVNGGAFYVCCSFSGITPAYAGKRTCKTQCWAEIWDHPRVCGEKPYFVDLL